MNDLNLRLAVAKAVAFDAGQLAKRHFEARRPGDYVLKGHQDFLTEADGDVESFIKSSIAKIFPDDSFIGEESGGEVGHGTWIIDPIDGTANFARGNPHFCISVGFFRHGRPEAGVIFAPMQNELYAAATGQGASLNGLPISASTTTSIREASIELGWNSRRSNDDYLALHQRAMDQGANVRRSSSGALGIAYVAAGRSDAYAEAHINAWDVTAGLVIASEAGARVSDFFSGDALTIGNAIVVTCSGIADQMAAISGLQLL